MSNEKFIWVFLGIIVFATSGAYYSINIQWFSVLFGLINGMWLIWTANKLFKS
jgi:hypothetical protein